MRADKTVTCFYFCRFKSMLDTTVKWKRTLSFYRSMKYFFFKKKDNFWQQKVSHVCRTADLWTRLVFQLNNSLTSYYQSHTVLALYNSPSSQIWLAERHFTVCVHVPDRQTIWLCPNRIAQLFTHSLLYFFTVHLSHIYCMFIIKRIKQLVVMFIM